MLGSRLLPEGEVGRVALLLLAVEGAGLGEELVDVSAGELAVMVVGVIFAHVEVHRAVADVGVARVEDCLDILLLLDDMARGVRLDRGREHVEALHVAVVAVEIVLHHLHRLQLLQPRLLGDFVFPLVGVMLQVAYVGDVAHVAHLKAKVGEVAVDDVEGNRGAGVAEVAVAVDRRAADVHPDPPLVERPEIFLVALERVINL